MFFCFGGVGLDLANAGDVIVEEGIQVRRGFALFAVAGAGVLGVEIGAESQERDGDGGPERDLPIGEVHEGGDDADLEE